MVSPGMRITIDVAMRARDVSRPRPEGESEAPAAGRSPEPPKRTRAAKNERRRLDKRGPRRAPQNSR